MKEGYKGEGSLWIRGKWRGLVAKLPSPSFPLHGETGKAFVRDGGGPIRALWVTAAAGIEGGKREGAAGD